MAHLRAALRVTLLLGVVAVSVPVYLAAYPFGRRARRVCSYPFFLCCAVMSGLRVRRDGVPPGGTGTLYVANHASYLDIPVLATLIDGLFVAKAEVRDWPLIGFLARIGRTVFVSRRAASVASERLHMAALLARGESIVLFPEGSSSDGTQILPFRPGLMSAARIDPNLPITVQPVSIAYGPRTGSGTEMSAAARDQFAWYGDMDLAPHLWALFGRRRGAAVTVTFHPARMSSDFVDTRCLTAWAEATVAAGLARSLGRAGDAPDAPEPVSPPGLPEPV